MKLFIKKILKFLLGKKLFNKIFYENVSTLNSVNFVKWWKLYSNENTLDPDLKLMVDNLVLNKSFKDYSPYWNFLVKEHIQLLKEKGINNFKQTIEKYHYWGEGTITSQLLQPIYDDKILTTGEYSFEEKKEVTVNAYQKLTGYEVIIEPKKDYFRKYFILVSEDKKYIVFSQSTEKTENLKKQ